MTETGIRYVERNVDGKTVRFWKITVRQRREMLGRLKDKARQQLRQRLVDHEIERDTAYLEMKNFDETPWGTDQWLGHINSADGQDEILRAALEKDHRAETEMILDSLAEEPLKLVAELCNLDFVKKDAKGDGSENPPTNPTPPYLAYGKQNPTPMQTSAA
jgi:hypothetical protein